jgi:hypothetical protein
MHSSIRRRLGPAFIASSCFDMNLSASQCCDIETQAKAALFPEAEKFHKKMAACGADAT